MALKHSRSDFVNERLRHIQENDLYRKMRKVVVRGSSMAVVDGKEAIHLCSNDYLGLSHNQKVSREALKALDEVSQCSSRLIAGNHPGISELEGMLAKHRKTEAALIFPTGYMANLGAITVLADKDTTIMSDELNHASIIDACRLSGAAIKVFKHNDVEHLEDLMGRTGGRIIVVTEGIFSMDGDLSQLRKICKIAHEHMALTILDDAHGDFIVGPDYSGVASLLKADVDVHVSSLSKGLGCFGGYVAASAQTVDLLINTSRQFIYTSALPRHLCSAAAEAFRLAKLGNLQKRLHTNVMFLRGQLKSAGFAIGSSNSQIVPVMIGPENLALEFSTELLEAGVYAQAVRYPTVRRGDARLRLSVTAEHTRKQLSKALEALRLVGVKKGLISP